MPKLGRRASVPLPVFPNTWMEVAAPHVADLLTLGSGSNETKRFWIEWSLVCKSWRDVVLSCRDVAAERLLCDSSMDFRLHMWGHVLSVPDGFDTNEFTELLLEGSYASWAEISRDSRRTYAAILRKRPDLHLQLTRILHALSTRFKDVGYCQGMNFVAGTVLLAITSVSDPGVFVIPPRNADSDQEEISPTSLSRMTVGSPDNFTAVIQAESTNRNEVIAFKICEKILMRNHFIRMYELGLHTRLTIWTFDKLVESLFPELHELINDELQVAADFYASSWFITLFCADLDFRSSIRILDLFIAKGPKALHRFGLACIASQLSRLMSDEVLEDPAEGLKILRDVAVNAVREEGVEAIIQKSLTKFKCVSNRLIADLQTTGKVHGGAQLMFITNPDEQRKSWLVIPMPNREEREHGDSSPSKAAFEAEWNKEEAAIRAGLALTKATHPNATGGSKMSQLLWKIRLRRGSLTGGKKDSSDELTPPMAKDDSSEADGDDMGLTGGGLAPLQGKHRTSKSEKASKAFKSFKKKLGNMMNMAGGSKGYSRGGSEGAMMSEE